MAEGVRFELTREQSPLPVFKTGALNHSATLPILQIQFSITSPRRNALATLHGARNSVEPVVSVALAVADERNRMRDTTRRFPTQRAANAVRNQLIGDSK